MVLVAAAAVMGPAAVILKLDAGGKQDAEEWPDK